MKKLLPLKSGHKALDIGAGIGKCMIALQTAGYDIYGIEPSTPFFDRAIGKMKIDPLRLQNSSIEEANFQAGQFDFITFGAVLEHLYDPDFSIRKAMNWLKEGGIMHIEVPSSDWLIAKIINFLYRIRGLDYVSNISPMHPPFHLYEFSLKTFQKHAEINGYEIAHYEYYVAPTYMPKIFNVVLVPWMQFFNGGMQLCVWLRKPKSN